MQTCLTAGLMVLSTAAISEEAELANSTLFDADTFYVGASVGNHDIDFDLNDRSFDTIFATLGYQLSSHWAIEARIGKGRRGYDLYGTDNNDYHYTEEIDMQYVFLTKGRYPLTENTSVTLQLGYSDTKLVDYTSVNVLNDLTGKYEPTDERREWSELSQGFVYGVGIDYRINHKFRVNIEYQNLPKYDKSYFQDYEPGNWTAINLGFTYTL